MRNQESAQDRDRSRLRQQTRNRSSKIASAQHPTHRFGRHQPPASRIAPDQTLETPKQLGSINQPHSPTPRPARLAIPASHNKNTRSHLISYPANPSSLFLEPLTPHTRTFLALRRSRPRDSWFRESPLWSVRRGCRVWIDVPKSLQSAVKCPLGAGCHVMPSNQSPLAGPVLLTEADDG